MREGWTYKTFGEVGSFLRGKSIQKADFVEKGMPCIHYGQIHTKFGVSVDKHLSEIPLVLYNKSIIASRGDVIIAITSEDLEGSCKSTAWLGNYDVAVSSHAAVYKHNINPKFIAYYLRSKSFYYEKMKYARGFKVMEIKPTDIERIPIPVPPIEEQERIVAELDLLSGIIEKKKEQLKAYDQLAHSIFYTMFGDPIDNPKGWEVTTIGDTCSITCGQDYKSVEDENGKYPIYGTGGIMGWANQFKCPKNSIIIGRKGNINNPILVDVDFWNVDTAFGVTPNNEMLSAIYFFFFCKEYDFTQHDVSVTIPSLRRTDILKIKLPIPPLSLQQEFAEKIEWIEAQKALIQQSIKETETLFNSRMDYYFG